MIQVPSIFASGALYQQNSVLELRGAAKEHVYAELRLHDDSIFSRADSDIDPDGRFSMTLATPPASRNICRILMWEESRPDMPLILEDILIGELWLASGQSNMQLENRAMSNYEAYLSSMEGLPLRIYCQNMLDNAPFEESQMSADMPMEPTDILTGSWQKVDDIKLISGVSAAATAFIYNLYAIYKKEGRDIPIGFVNCNVGSTRIEGWLPLHDLDEDDETAVGSVVRPDPKTWNTFGAENFIQSTAMYNLKVYPLRGLRFHSIIWYQGESNVDRPGSYERYKRYMERYYYTYKDMFAAHNQFHILMAQIFPYAYGESGECKLTCINQAIAELARDDRDRFTAVSHYDITPVWGYRPFSYPIHPINKYPLGERMAEVYARKATAPTLREVRRDGKMLLLTFDNLGGQLRIEGKRLYGLYIRGEGTEYIEAEGSVIDRNTLPCGIRSLRSRSMWHISARLWQMTEIYTDNICR